MRINNIIDKLKIRNVVLLLCSIFVVLTSSAQVKDDYLRVLNKVILNQDGNIRYNWASDIKQPFERAYLYRDTKYLSTGGSDMLSQRFNITDTIVSKDIKTLHQVYEKSMDFDSIELKKILGFNPLRGTIFNTAKYCIVKNNDPASHLYLFYDRSIMHCFGIIDKYGRHFFYNKNRGYLDNIKYKQILVFQEVTFDSLYRIKEAVDGSVNKFTLLDYNYNQNKKEPETLFYYESANCFDPIDDFVYNCEPPHEHNKSFAYSYKRDSKGNWVEKNSAMRFENRTQTFDPSDLETNEINKKYTLISESIFFISQKRIIKYKK